MGYPTQQQKVDYLFKKIGFTKTKTGVAEDQTSGFSGDTKKAPPNEAIASPLVVPSTSLWSDSSLIPTNPPGSDSAYVEGYRTSNALRMTVDSTVANERTFIARETWGDSSSEIQGDWIDTQFGADYLVKVYMGNPSGISTNLSAAGTSGKDDVWFFDYSSGVLNFNGADLDGQLAGISTDNVYLVGYRYVGGKGAKAPAGIGTFHDLIVYNNFSVGGISTFSGLVDINAELNTTGGRIVGAATSNIIPFLYNQFTDLPSASTYHGAFAHVHQYGKGYFAHANNWFEIVSKEIDGTVGLGTEKYNVGHIDATSLKVTGITTLGSIGISTGLISGPAITYIDPATVGDNTGLLVVKGNLQVDGTQTTVNSSTMTVTDKNIELAKGAANDAAADGGGITVDSGDGDKTWQWVDATDSWTSSEHIRIPDGKVFGFATDTNTYIGRPAADTIAFTHGGSEKVRITSAGKVGIGSDNPQELLSLMANGPCGISLLDSGHGQAATTIKIGNQGKDLSIVVPEDILTSLTNGNYKINTNGSERFRITGSTGEVGINTANPLYKLDVRGSVGGFDDLRAPHSDTVKTYTVTVATKDATHRYQGTGSNNGYKIDGEFSPFITLTPGRTYRFEQSDSSNNNHPIIFYLEADKTTEYTTGVTYYADGAKATSSAYNSAFNAATTKYTQIVVGDETPIVLHYQCYNHGYMGHAVQVNSNVVNTNYDAFFRGNFKIGTGTSVSTILDEDNFASDSAAALATQQSIKAYVDSSNPTGSNLAVSADSGSNESINLATEVLDIEGTANEIETATGTNKVVIGLPNNVSIGGTLNVGAGVSAVGIITAYGGFETSGYSDSAGNYKYFKAGRLKIYDNGSHIHLHGGYSNHLYDHSGVRRILTNNLLIYNTASSRYYIGAKSLSGVDLYWAGATNNGIKLSTSGIGVTVFGQVDTTTLNTGDATFTGTISAGSTTGIDGYYLKSVGTGVTWAAFPSSRTGLTTTATAGQTTFNFSYNIGFVDVFVNGVKLPSSEFTASNGSTIVLDDAAFANDTLEFISLNTLPVTSSGGAQNLTGLADVTISGTPVIGETLQHNGSEFVNDFTVSATTTSTSQTAISSLPIATYRSVEYTIQVTEGTKYHVTKVLAIHDGTNVTFNEFGTLTTSTSLSTFTLDINSGNMRLLATPASTNSTVFKVKFTGIKV